MSTVQYNLLASIHKELISLGKTLSQIKSSSKDVLSFEETLVYLGVSESFLYKKTASNEIPFFKPTNGKLFFLKSELNQWIQKEIPTDNVEGESMYNILNSKLNR